MSAEPPEDAQELGEYPAHLVLEPQALPAELRALRGPALFQGVLLSRDVGPLPGKGRQWPVTRARNG
jgi:hypothetical protein